MIHGKILLTLFLAMSSTLGIRAATYHVDPVNGPIKSIRELSIKPGDTVLFRRGSVFVNEGLYPPNGTKDAPITLGAYGDGARPHFKGPAKGRRSVADGQRHIRFEGLAFSDSSIHGYTTIDGEDIRITDCAFFRIGGEPWRKDPRIHYGNAIEFWHTCKDIVVSNCVFDQIYDSGVTTQGPHEDCGPFVNISIVDNTFSNFGMAALEIRDHVPIGMVFARNVCRKGGEGFSSDGLPRPRLSEIWPEPMGHNVFIWRLDGPEANGSLTIKDNDFVKPKFGENIYYHGVAESAKAQIVVK